MTTVSITVTENDNDTDNNNNNIDNISPKKKRKKNEKKPRPSYPVGVKRTRYCVWHYVIKRRRGRRPRARTPQVVDFERVD